MSLTAPQIIELLDLKPLPQEGGYYRETYRAEIVLPGGALPPAYLSARNAATAIYFLLTPDEYSAWHILPSDEVFHFYAGDAVEMWRLSLRMRRDDLPQQTLLGADLAAGERPQVVVPGDVWQACRLASGGAWALLGCTVAPGFDFDDFHVATEEDLAALKDEFRSLASVIDELAPRERR